MVARRGTKIRTAPSCYDTVGNARHHAVSQSKVRDFLRQTSRRPGRQGRPASSSSHGGGGGGSSSRSSFYSTDSSSSHSSSTTSSDSGSHSVTRGSFGSFAHAFGCPADEQSRSSAPWHDLRASVCLDDARW